jgi:diguanylate cyclase (GGDEF)-like protein
MLDNGAPFFAEDGSFRGYVGANIDITDRRRAEEELQRLNEELAAGYRNLQLLSRMNDHLQVCNSLEEIHSVISHFAPELFAGNAGAIFLINASRSLVEEVVVWGSTMAHESVFKQEDCWALRQGKTHRMDRADGGLKCAHLGGFPANGYLCVPMIAHGEVLGILHLEFQPPRVALVESERERETLHRLAAVGAEHLGLALSDFRLREALRAQSVRDPLTQLYNRSYLFESLEREIVRAKRRKSELGVVMIDVDHFKQFNDVYGHQAGDVVLQEVGRYLRNSIRGEDIAARYGGEEFTLVLLDLSADGFGERLEKLRCGVSQLKVVHHGQQLGNISISMGVAFYQRHGASVDELLKAADRALYQAKQSGRNRIFVA